MSTQGTGSIDAHSFERQLLDSWGRWAQGGEPRLTSLGLWRGPGQGYMFTDEDLLQADMAIAGMPKAHKNVIKTVYLRRKGYKIDETRKQSAVAYFSESLQRIGEDG